MEKHVQLFTGCIGVSEKVIDQDIPGIET